MEAQVPVEAEEPDTRPAWMRWLTSPKVRNRIISVLGAAAPFLCLYLPEAIPQQICRAIAPLLFM